MLELGAGGLRVLVVMMSGLMRVNRPKSIREALRKQIE